MHNKTRDLDAEYLRADLSDHRFENVLEVGCGTGKNTKWLLQHSRVTGIDFSSEMLKRCKTVAPDAQLHQADLNEPWPIENQQVNLVLFSLVLEHIEDLDHIAWETARVLTPGGRVRISELHPLRQLEGKKARFMNGEELIEIPAFTHTIEEYKRAFTEASFQFDSMCEPRAKSDPSERPPRLIILEFALCG